MKKILYLFLLLPFLWQCGGSGNFFEPANLESSGRLVSRQPTALDYSIHSIGINANALGTTLNVTSATFSFPTIDYLTDDDYVFYGRIAENRDIGSGTSISRGIWILLEIRQNGAGEIEINSAYTERDDLYSPLDLYNARTELPTVLKSTAGGGGDRISLGVWPKYSKLTHERLATTNTSRFNYINSLQSRIYTNIVPEGGNSLLVYKSTDIGNEISSSTSITDLKTIVSGKVWNSVNYPDSLTPVSGATNYYFYPDSTLHASTSAITTTPSLHSPNYGWDIWTFNGLTPDGPVTEHYLFTYRELTLALRVENNSPSPGDESQDLLKLVFADSFSPDIGFNNVYSDLVRLSIAP